MAAKEGVKAMPNHSPVHLNEVVVKEVGAAKQHGRKKPRPNRKVRVNALSRKERKGYRRATRKAVAKMVTLQPIQSAEPVSSL